MPRRRLITPEVVVIAHPWPVSTGHLLLLPRNRVPGLDDASRDVAKTVEAMREAAQALVVISFGNPADVITVINGGARQDVRLLHMHVLSDPVIAAALREAELALVPSGGRVRTTVRPIQGVHLLVSPGASEAVSTLRRAIADRHLASGGYSLMTLAASQKYLHLVAGAPAT